MPVPKQTPSTVPPTNRVFIGGIPTHTTDVEFLQYFASFGDITEYAFPTSETRPGRNRGFGLIAFKTIDEAIALVASDRTHMIRAKVVD